MPTGSGLPEEGVKPVGYEDFPVMVTFKVPAFDVVVERGEIRIRQNHTVFSPIHRGLGSRG